MKTERRHELQTNDLADWLGQHTAQIKPYAKTLLAMAILLVAVLIATLSYRSYQQRQIQRSWDAYYKAVVDSAPDGLREIAVTYAGTPAANWALQSAADLEMATGTEIDLYRDRAEALERFTTARDAYLQVLKSTRDELLRQRALMGLAQAYEALNKFDEARQQYEKIIQTWPDTSLAELAGDRLALVQQPSTQAFYDWFSEQKPRSPELSGDPGTALQTPSIYDDLPSSDEVKLPDPSELRRSMGQAGFGALSAPDSATEMPFLDNADGGSGAADDASGSLDKMRASQFPVEENTPAEVKDESAFDQKQAAESEAPPVPKDSSESDASLPENTSPNTSEDDAPDDATSDDNASEDDASEDNTSEDNASDDNASDDNASDDNASEDNASEDNASVDNASVDDASEDDASEDQGPAAPGGSTSEDGDMPDDADAESDAEAPTFEVSPSTCRA